MQLLPQPVQLVDDVLEINRRSSFNVRRFRYRQRQGLFEVVVFLLSQPSSDDVMQQSYSRHVRFHVLQFAQDFETKAIGLTPRPVSAVHVVTERQDQRHDFSKGTGAAKEVAGGSEVRQFRGDRRDRVAELRLKHEAGYFLRKVINARELDQEDFWSV